MSNGASAACYNAPIDTRLALEEKGCMRLAYTSDLHGDIESYRALFELAARYRARAAIVGGDLLPHSIKLERALVVQQEFVEKWLRPLLKEFRQAHPQIDVYLLAGNDDWAAAVKLLEDLAAEQLAYPLHEQVYQLAPRPKEESAGGPPEAPLWLAGYACVPVTPFSIKDYEAPDDGPLPPYSFRMAYGSWRGSVQPVTATEILSRPGIARALEALARRSSPSRTIYICHTPPADTPLDMMSGRRHIGSRALRTFIERQTPLLSLHGHVHEAPQISGRYSTKIGPTWCVNPGHDQRRFQAVTFDTDDIPGTLEHTVFGKPN